MVFFFVVVRLNQKMRISMIEVLGNKCQLCQRWQVDPQQKDMKSAELL